MRVFSLIITFLITGYCNAQNAAVKLIQNSDNNSLLWQVSGNGLTQPSYLFGTFHLLCKEDINFSGQLKTAISNAKEVYMELDMDDPATTQKVLSIAYMKDNKKIKDFLDSIDYKRLNNYFNDSLNMPLAFFEKMKPYFLMDVLYLKMLPCAAPSGVDEEILQLAKKDKKEIKGLETIEFQAAVFDSIPYAEQAKELLKSIDSMAIFKDEFNTMLAVYRNQEITKIGELFNETEFGIDEHKDILLDNRNKNWVSKLKEIMLNESVFVAVGAGHLAGDTGLIALLRKEGYTVIPLLNK